MEVDRCHEPDTMVATPSTRIERGDTATGKEHSTIRDRLVLILCWHNRALAGDDDFVRQGGMVGEPYDNQERGDGLFNIQN